MASGIGKVPAILADIADQRPGVLVAGAGGEHQDADVGVLVDQLDDFLGGRRPRGSRGRP